MSEPKRILIWDDNNKQVIRLESAVIDSKISNDWDIKIVVKSGDFGSFLPYLRENSSNFDLFILDCLEGEGKQSFKVIDTALKALKEPLEKTNGKVIAVTIDSKTVESSFTNLGKQYNFCIPVLKMDFLDSENERSCENILASTLNLTITKKGLTRGIDLTFEPDIYINHLLKILGGEEILKLMIYAGKKANAFRIKNDSQIEIQSLSQGLSGAIVLKVKYISTSNSQITKFVKISVNEKALQSELINSKNDFQDNFPKKYTILYETGQPIKFKNYYFIVAKLFENSISLRDFLQKDSDSNRLLPVIKELFLLCFKPLYKVNCEPKEIKNKSLSILQIFNTDRLSFLKKSIKELDTLTGNQTAIINLINNILNFYNSDSTFYTSQDAHYVWVHGDLHGNNILINENYNEENEENEINIIDPANIEVSHWSRDICMLIVDIFAYGIDAGEKEFYGITNITKWKEMGELILQNHAIDNNGKNKGVIDSINWLCNRDNLISIFTNSVFNIWEFQLALCVEFLRISYKQDQLPPGKRAACLLIGVGAFKTALETFEIQKQRNGKDN